MSSKIEIKDWYKSQFDSFEQRLNGGKSTSVHPLRKDALNRFERLEFPTQKDEEWKYTNISPLLKHNFVPSNYKVNVQNKLVRNFLFKDFEHNLLVFVNGHFADEHSNIKKLANGVVAGSLSNEIKNNSFLIEKHFAKYAPHQKNIFTALSTAFTNDGAFVYVPDDKIVEDPIHILYITSSFDNKLIVQPRNLFIAGKNTQVTIIEHYVSAEESVYFTNSVTEIVADESSVVDHIKLQEESRNAFHIARMEIDQERNSNFSSHSISIGGKLTRNDFNSRFNDEGSECTLNGLYMIEGNQLFDAHTLIDHAMPHCNSHEHYKGILSDNSKGVFNGKVIVRPDAQKTNAFQENNNILLSNDALVNTKPQLEIFADDVKCSHGATIGQLDEEAGFYLKSRGIGEETGRAILLHAFASDVITSIKTEPVRNYIEKIITDRFNQ